MTTFPPKKNNEAYSLNVTWDQTDPEGFVHVYLATFEIADGTLANSAICSSLICEPGRRSKPGTAVANGSIAAALQYGRNKPCPDCIAKLEQFFHQFNSMGDPINMGSLTPVVLALEEPKRKSLTESLPCLPPPDHSK